MPRLSTSPSEFQRAYERAFAPPAISEWASPRSPSGSDFEAIDKTRHRPEIAMASLPSGFGLGLVDHVPIVTLHEAVALSLNIDPKQLRHADTYTLTARRRLTRVPSSNGGYHS